MPREDGHFGNWASSCQFNCNINDDNTRLLSCSLDLETNCEWLSTSDRNFCAKKPIENQAIEAHIKKIKKERNQPT